MKIGRWTVAALVTLSLTLPGGRAAPAGGEKLTINGLRGQLTNAEWSQIIGHDGDEGNLQIGTIKFAKRAKRDVLRRVSIETDAIQEAVSAELKPSNDILDPNFLFIRRYANRTEPIAQILDSDDPNECLYRSDTVALSFCGGIRGVIAYNNTLYTVHPLPERFATNDTHNHVIVRRTTKTFNANDSSNLPHRSEGSNHDNFRKIHKWSKYRRKLPEAGSNRTQTENISGEGCRENLLNLNIDSGHYRNERKKRSVVPAIFVETAVFVDRDLHKHMSLNYPKDTERELVRFVLAMINAVQLLYHDPTLGQTVNFVLKRLEILHEDPASLKRPHDIDRFLSNFCAWQRLENPTGDNDPLHWDHALILTGLDLYVVSKHGKVSSQVVGLAPVAGMCTVTSSCTVNEGRHFESVYVVAHEIGHNLGMRHDGPLAENECDPSSYIMSPTLGSGKITWSPCSRRYLQNFLDTSQSRCLLDHGSSAGQLDHSAEGLLPGERFGADQQCMLKYGKDSRHATRQPLSEVCRDLHCRRERYTWTSHPALEGTKCGEHKWCRGGRCAGRNGRDASGIPIQPSAPIAGGWGSWSPFPDCASGCLHSDSGRLSTGSTGIQVSSRKCDQPRPENGGAYCEGHSKKYQTCMASQCLNVPRMTISEFADQICLRAREVDPDLTGTGFQRQNSDAADACGVWCKTHSGGLKSRGWTFPDGTTCQTKIGRKPSHCINGMCVEFKCISPNDVSEDYEFVSNIGHCNRGIRDSERISSQWRRSSDPQWYSASGCHYHCVSPGSGIRLVKSKGTSPKNSIQLCQPDKFGCGRLKTPSEHATYICTKYKEHVRRLSGVGMQISPALEDPDRPCRIACQDEAISHRFYLVNGQEGWFPFGTSCSKNKPAYCISGKCLEFGSDDTPLSETEFTLPLLPRNNKTMQVRLSARTKRSVDNPIRIKAVLEQRHLDELISTLNFTNAYHQQMDNTKYDNLSDTFVVDFSNPVFVAPEDEVIARIGRHHILWDY